MSKSQERKQNINRVTQVALNLFLNNGIVNTSINMIARKADLSPMSIYRYFGSKDALVNHTWQYALVKFFDLFMQRYEDREHNCRNGYEKYIACMEVYFELYQEFPQWFPYTLEMFSFASDKRVSDNFDMKSVFWKYYGNEIPVPAMKALMEGQSDGSIRQDVSIPKVYQVMLNAYTAPSIYEESTTDVKPEEIIEFTSRLISNYIKTPQQQNI